MNRLVLSMIMFLLIIISIPTPVIAYDQFHTGPREEPYLIRVNADQDANYTATFNISDPANEYLLNFNQTIHPFMNDSGIIGTFTGSWMPPALVTYDNTSTVLTRLSSLVKFESNQVMSGSSYSWWRVPVENPFTTACELKIWKLENPELMNWTYSTHLPTTISHPTLVWDQIYNLKSATELNKTHRWWNGTTQWGANFTNLTVNMAWVEVISPLHSDTVYAYQWLLALLPSVKIHFSLCDIGNDGILSSWLHTDDKDNVTDVDLECSVIHQYGMGSAVSGFEIKQKNSTSSTSLNFYSTLSRAITNGEYLTFMMPFIKDISNTSNAYVQIRDWNSTWTQSYYVASNNGTDFTIRSFLWNKAYSTTTFFINITFHNSSNLIFIYDQDTVYNPFYDDESSYATHRFRVYNHPDYPQGQYVYFKPYHSLQISNGSWGNYYLWPVYILDGHVISLQELRLFDASAYYPKEVYHIFNGQIIRWVLFGPHPIAGFLLDQLQTKIANFIDIDPQEFKDAMAAGILLLGEVVYLVGFYLVELGKWFADNASYVFAAMFWGLGLIAFVPVWIFLVIFIHRVKTFFLIFARDGPEDAGTYAARFMARTKKDFQNLPIVKFAKKRKPIIMRRIKKVRRAI